MFRQWIDFEKGRSIAPCRRHASKLAAVLMILLVLLPYSVSFGDQHVSLSLVNKTSYYLHALINNQPFVYIAPGGVVTYESETLASISAEVSYSPGQGITGRKLKTFEPVRHDTQSQTCSDNSRKGCQSSVSSDTSVEPLTWSIVSSDLVPD